ncbi:MAG TPA: phospho-N-acetylmuramoyl-pentapeptide-transferase, partial [Candidatus Atribacteria bacterium]|jgi:phospho-N-acetylmuramoyl-pentapeptide-transferase|nr:MAG: Phospho-N-acetylmuramoyl-pentapeptide-transferase [Atribacteria bacterium 34_128]HAJ33985.1 phospho-N-acetylmuramoyl-pentapeptide-transferase [Candidatus Atribacteria bacterium]
MTYWPLIFLISFLMPVITLPYFINYLKKHNMGQRIRQEGPDLHQHKMGTPTMGGVIVILTLIIIVLLLVPYNKYVLWSLIITVGFGLIGLVDDLIKYLKKRSLGLLTMQKLFLQIAFALIATYCVQQNTDLGTEIYIPFLKSSIELGIMFVPFVALVMVSSVNAVNLTDGLDGLAAGLIIISMFSLALIAYMQNIESIGIFSLIVAFTSLAFLVYNFFPAQIFLGDVGSLALGGALASVAIFTRTELFLLIIGGVFVIETLSVILQVVSVKLRGKIIFKMSPIHHHFELCGWKEPKIIIRFWIAGIILAIIGIAGI